MLWASVMSVPMAVSAASLTLAWNPPSDSSVVGYVLTYGTQSGVYINELNVGSTAQATVNDLTGGVVYYFVVRSYDATGVRSAPSNEVAVAPAVPAATPAPTIESLSLTSDLVSPQPLGATMLWTASAVGGTAPYQFKWYVFKDGVAIQTVDWSASSRFSWTPADISSAYAVGVSVRSAGSTSLIAEMTQRVPFVVSDASAAPTPTPTISSLVLASSVPSPQPLGTSVVWTAVASGGVAPYQFNWYVFKDGVAIQTSGWTTQAAFTWQPAEASANYEIGVSARSNGSASATAEAVRRVPYSIVAPAPTPAPTPAPPPTQVTPPAIVNLTLIDSTTDRSISAYDPIPNGTALKLSRLPSRLNMRANVAGTTSRVVFVLDGAKSFTDSVAPFALAGDTNGNYLDWMPSRGSHTLKATPYSSDGTVGPTYTLTFTVR